MYISVCVYRYIVSCSPLRLIRNTKRWNILNLLVRTAGTHMGRKGRLCSIYRNYMLICYFVLVPHPFLHPSLPTLFSLLHPTFVLPVVFLQGLSPVSRSKTSREIFDALVGRSPHLLSSHPRKNHMCCSANSRPSLDSSTGNDMHPWFLDARPIAVGETFTQSTVSADLWLFDLDRMIREFSNRAVGARSGVLLAGSLRSPNPVE